MADMRIVESKVVRDGGAAQGIAGMLWFGGWLFTIAFAKLVWWKALLALLLWPYFLGIAIGR